MISLQSFNDWLTIAGYVTIIFFFFIYPLAKTHNIYLKGMFSLGSVVACLSPFLVAAESVREVESLTMSTGAMVQCFSFILLFYCIANKSALLERVPYFFWFCYAIAAYNLFEKLIVEVLFNSNYKFFETLKPVLDILGIDSFNFLGPITYLIKFIFLGCFFYQAFKISPFKVILRYVIYGLVVFELVQIFVFKSYLGYSSLSSTVKNIYYIVLPATLLYRIYRYPAQSVSLNKNIFFWICLGFLLVTLIQLFLELIFTKLYQTDESGFYKNYVYRNVSEIVLFTLLIVGVWQAKYMRFLPKEY